MKNFLRSSTVVGLMLIVSSGYSFLFFYQTQPPVGMTGADGSTCTDCHSDFPLNNAGGSVSLAGLPDGGYVPGATYTFSVVINHSNPDRTRWGFEVTARNSSNENRGTFSTTNANAAPLSAGRELGHSGAVFTNAQGSYSYTNLKWTAPASPTAADKTIKFYIAGNAANGNSGSDGDYIYNATATFNLAQVYTFTGTGNWNDANNWSNQTIPPTTLPAGAEIVIDHQLNGECLLNVSQTISTNAKITLKPGKFLKVPGNLIIQN